MRTVRIVTCWICNSLLVWPVHKAGCPPFLPIPSLFIQNVIIIWWKPFPLKANNQPRKVKMHIHSFIYINTFFLSLSLTYTPFFSLSCTHAWRHSMMLASPCVLWLRTSACSYCNPPHHPHAATAPLSLPVGSSPAESVIKQSRQAMLTKYNVSTNDNILSWLLTCCPHDAGLLLLDFHHAEHQNLYLSSISWWLPKRF